MALAVADRVRETTTTTGTGTVTLAGAVTGYQSFSAIGNGNTTYYTINAGSQWEVGIGTYTASGTTLSRDTVLASSNAGSLVNFSAGTKDVFATYPAGKAVYQDASGNVGIGTASPGAKLAVVGTTKIGEGAASNTSKLMVNTLSGTAAGIQLFQDGNESWIIQNPASTTALTFANSGTERMRITGGGFVGIGTSSPSSKLTVLDGDIEVNATGLGNTLLSFNGTTANLTVNSSSAPLVFGTNSTERMRITSAGNVGIGTTSPAEKLSVVGNIELVLGANRSVNIGSSTNYFYALSSVGDDFQIIEAGTTPRLTIKYPSGNVGIGTSSPASPLEVYNASGGWIRFGNASGTGEVFADGSATLIGSVSNHPLLFRIGSAEKMRIDTSGNVGIGLTPSHALDVYSAANGIIRVGGGNATNQGAAYFVKNANNSNTQAAFGDRARIFGGTPDQLVSIFTSALPLTFDVNGGEKMRITSAGDVGIGTGSPATKLHIYGSGNQGFTTQTTGGGNPFIRFISDGVGTQQISANVGSVENMTFSVGASERMRITGGGNILIGTTTEGWVSGSAALRLKTGAVWTYDAASNNQIEIEANLYQSALGVYNFANTGVATQLRLIEGEFFFNRSSASGTAGAAATMNTMVKIDSSGNMGIGTTAPSQRLDVTLSSGSEGGGLAVTNSLAGGYGSGINFYSFRTDGTTKLTAGAIQMYGQSNWADAANTSSNMRFYTVGNNSLTERMRLDASGNLGIGTSSISYRLHVNSGAATTVGFFQSTGTSSFIGLSNASYTTYLGSFNDGSFRIQTPGSGFSDKVTVDISGNLLVGTTSATSGYLMSVNGALTLANGYSLSWGAYNSGGPTIAGSTNFLAFYPNGASSGEKMRITSAGQLLLGTTSLVTKLGVVGYDATYNNTATFGSGLAAQYLDILCGFALTNGTPGGVASNTTMTLRSSGSSAGELAFATGNTEQMRITSAGNVGVGTTSPSGKLTIQNANAYDELTFAGTEFTNIYSYTTSGMDVGIISSSSAYLRLLTNATEQVRITSAGNVGIGTSSPGAKLEVNGSIAFGTSLTSGVGVTTQDCSFELGGNRGGDGNAYIDLHATSGTDYEMRILRGGGANGALDIVNNGTGVFTLNATGATAMRFATSNTERMRIGADGEVAIATSSAIYTAANRGNLTIGGSASSLLFLGTGGTTGTYLAHFQSNNSVELWNGANGHMAFATNNAERFRITSTGGITSSDLADAVGYKGLPQNSQTTGYTLALSDMGKHISITTGNITIPANGSVAFPVGAAVTIFNNSGSTQTISITTDTLRQAGTTNTGTRTLAAYGVATVLKVASTTWVVSGNVT